MRVRHAQRRDDQPTGCHRHDRRDGQKLRGGNKTEAVALAMRRLLDQDARAGSLFGAHRGSVRIRSDRTSPRRRPGRRHRSRNRAVTDSLLLDTHIALWLDNGDDHLRSSTRTLIDGCWQNGGTIRLSAVSVWKLRCSSTVGGSSWIFRSRHGLRGFSNGLASSRRCSAIVPRTAATVSISSNIAIRRTGS
jgi:hypothetical protein